MKRLFVNFKSQIVKRLGGIPEEEFKKVNRICYDLARNLVVGERDGRFERYTATTKNDGYDQSQRDAFEAQARAGLPPADSGYNEATGNPTPLPDRNSASEWIGKSKRHKELVAEEGPCLN